MPDHASPTEFVYTFLADPANSDSREMNVDGSSTAVNFEYTVPTGSKLLLQRFNVVIVDGSMQVVLFGAVNLATGNGCLFKIFDAAGNERLDFTDGLPIKANADWTPLAGVDAIFEATAGDDMLPVRFTVAKAGAPMQLAAGDVIRFTVRDDIRGLTKFRIMVQGILV